MSDTKYLQLAIVGIAEDKEFNDALGLPTKEIKRVELAEFIYNQCKSGRRFANAIDVSPAAITKWLYTDTMPSMRTIRNIANKFGVTVDDVGKLFTAAAG